MQPIIEDIKNSLLNWFNSFSMEDIFKPSLEKPWFFTEYSFLLVFGLFLILYSFFSAAKLIRLALCIVFSLFFYFKSSGIFLILFLILIISDFSFGILIENAQKKQKKIYLAVATIFSLSFLLYFKYANFFIDNVNWITNGNISMLDLFLPIGISFYTFQSLSYLFDIYRGEIKASRNFLDYSFYMTFFPHLVAGPIVRAKDFIPSIHTPLNFDRELFKESFLRICIGLVKKLVIADYLAKFVDLVHEAPAQYSSFENTMSMYAYTFQIYFDFSGYSDIAIGIALMLGYRLKENFDSPYKAIRLSEFWRKWHISLSNWLRDYIYIPLGGNRKGALFTYLFLLITMLIGGLWHGADWKFIFWGGAHGIGLILDKLVVWPLQGKAIKIKKVLTGILVFHFVALCWIFFRASGIETAWSSLSQISLGFSFIDCLGFIQNRTEFMCFFCLAVVVCFLPETMKKLSFRYLLKLPAFAWIFILLICLQLIVQFKDNLVQPFIYFQF